MDARRGRKQDLVEFAFESQVADDLTPASFARLARQSWSSNVRAGLTGELRLQDGRFVQVVEGRCADVLRLAARILADPAARRHPHPRFPRAAGPPLSPPGRCSGFDLGAAPAEAAATPRRPTSASCRRGSAARLLALGLPAS